jgi:hypothetical protein
MSRIGTVILYAFITKLYVIFTTAFPYFWDKLQLKIMLIRLNSRHLKRKTGNSQMQI